eukprot:scaffold26699_cov71-Skeletonema_dohrnii-CCMP3373.AAC.2
MSASMIKRSLGWSTSTARDRSTTYSLHTSLAYYSSREKIYLIHNYFSETQLLQSLAIYAP